MLPVSIHSYYCICQASDSLLLDTTHIWRHWRCFKCHYRRVCTHTCTHKQHVNWLFTSLITCINYVSEALTANTFMQTTLNSHACGVTLCPTESSVWTLRLHTHIDQARKVSLSQVVQHRGFIEAGEVSHILHFTKARRVHPLHLLPGQGDVLLAVCQLDLYLITPLLPNTGRLGSRKRRNFHECFMLLG